MTASAGAHQDRDDLFVADFYPQLGEYLAEQHATGYDPGAGRVRFLAWLSEHAEAPSAADPVKEYLKQIGQVPGLSAEQETELAKRIEAGSARRSGVDRRGRHPGQESPAGGELAAGGVAG
jgi:DNA-directed RNA polymerase sigma subunit (sigma70/sigma32)